MFCIIHKQKSLCYFCKDLFFILGVLCVNFLTGTAPFINKLVFKKPILQFFNHYFIISFIKFVAMILLQILKLIRKFLVSILFYCLLKKEVMSNTVSNFISNTVKGIHSSEKRLKIFEYLKNNIYTITVLFFCKKHTHWRKMKKSGKMISKILCFFHMVVQILVE